MSIQQIGSTTLPQTVAQPAVAPQPQPQGLARLPERLEGVAASSAKGAETTKAQEADKANKAKQEAESPANADEVKAATEKIQAFVSPVSNDIKFSIDEETGISVIKVIDRATDEVIRQIPGKEMIEIAKTLDRLQGLLVKQQA